EREAVEQPLDLRAEAAGDDRDASAAGGRELVEQADDHGCPVDREDRLREPLGDGPKPRAQPRRHDDGVSDHAAGERSRSRSGAARSRIAPAISSLEALASRCSPSGPTTTTSFSRASKPMSVRETSLKTIRSACLRTSF